MTRRATQLDVARKAGVSRATVSNVLTNRTGGNVPISAETRQRVLAAAEELSYQPHAAARSLRSGRSGAVGVLIPDANNPHFWSIVRGAESVTRVHGYQLALTVAESEAEGEQRSLRALAQQRLDGLLLFLTYPSRVVSELETLRLQGAAIVTFGRILPGKDAVVMDYGPGACELTEHLLKLGHRRIGFIHGVARPALGADRLFAYRRTLRAAGVPFERELIVHCGPSLEDGLRAALRLLDLSPRPTAILGVNDLMAISVLQAASERGIAVPGELSVAGFDDIAMAAHVVPPLTTVHAGGDEAGRCAAELLLYRLSNPDALPQQVTVPVQVVVRRSSGPCPPAERTEDP
jgi:LacI family transcriptional regulator, galactose operon repressor